MAKGEGVTGEMSTSDDGKTWTVTTIEIPEFSFWASTTVKVNNMYFSLSGSVNDDGGVWDTIFYIPYKPRGIVLSEEFPSIVSDAVGESS